jgi:hypothetical protein
MLTLSNRIPPRSGHCCRRDSKPEQVEVAAQLLLGRIEELRRPLHRHHLLLGAVTRRDQAR